MAHCRNRILTVLPENEQNIVAPLLKSSTLKQHDVLYDIHQTIEKVYFAFDAAISLVVPLSSGQIIETAMVGHDGVVGAAAVLDGRVAMNRAVVQLPGACRSCETNALRQALNHCSTLSALLTKHEQVLLAYTQQLAACNATHSIESRLARWLLRARDLLGSDELGITQECIAEMLGVRRTSLSVIAHPLQKAGLINVRRGQTEILNADALQQVACECYETVKLQYETLHVPSNVFEVS
jgi:CRP-like cAMP-binding protein